MKVGLIDADNYENLDSCFPNLALMKLSAYHKSKGDEVEWYQPLFTGHCDIVYISKVFSFTPDYPYFIDADEIIGGGTGYAIHLENGKEVFDKEKHKDLPYEIEHQYPDYSLYGITDTAYGFMSRGCPRGCGFCHVAPKEGRCSVKVADLSEFWSGQKNINLCDPNTLACKDWEDILTQLADSKAKVEFNQGVDIRMIDEKRAAALKEAKLQSVHFAFDRYQDKELIVPKFEQFTEIFGMRFNRSKVQCYVLVNFDTTLEQDLERVMFLRGLNISPYIMRYDKEHIPHGHVLNALARWCNNRLFFWKYPTFREYLVGERKDCDKILTEYGEIIK